MAGVIQYGGIRLDVFVDTKGVRGMRTDMAALTRVVNEAKGAAGSYERNLARLVKLQEEGKLSGEQSKEMLDAIINKYLKGAKSVAEYDKMIQHLIQTMPGLKPQLEAMAKAFKDNADAEALAAAKARQTRKLEKMAREQAMDDVRKQEREAERAARKAQRDAETRRAANKKIVDSVKEMATGHSSAMKQVVRDLDMVDKAYRRNKVSTDIADKAINKTLEGFLRSAKGPKAQAAAIAELTAVYPQYQHRIDQIVNKLNAEAAAEKAAATAKKQAAAAKKDADRQMKLDMALVNGLLTKQAGEAGKLRAALDSIARVQKTGALTQQQFNVALRQASSDYFKNAKSMQDVISLKNKLTNLTYAESVAINKAAAAKMQEIASTERQVSADRRAAEAKRSAANANKFAMQIIREGQSPMDALLNKVAKLNSLYLSGQINANKYSAAMASLNRQMQSLNKETGMAEQLTTRFLSLAFLKEMGTRALALRTNAVDAYVELRDSLIKLEVIIGDVAEAKALYNQLRAIAVQSNQTTSAVMRSAVTMAQFGVASNKLAVHMKKLTEIAAGNSDRLQALALAHGQVAAAGRLTGQETLQFVNAGFSPLAELARTTGKSMQTLRKEMENGLITFDMYASTLQTATSAGGRFAGMTEKLSKEYSGSVSRMTDSWNKFLETLGDFVASNETLDFLTKLIDKLTALTNLLNSQAYDELRRRQTMTAKEAVAEYETRKKLMFAFQAELKYFDLPFAEGDLGAARRELRRERLLNRNKDSLGPGFGTPDATTALSSPTNAFATAQAREIERLASLLNTGMLSAKEASFRLNEYLIDINTKGLERYFVDTTQFNQLIENAANAQKAAILAQKEQVEELLNSLSSSAKTDLDKFLELRSQLDFAVSNSMISVSQAQVILDRERQSLINLQQRNLSPQEKYNNEFQRLTMFLQVGAISLQEFNDSMNLFAEDLNKPFLDRAKEVRDSLKKPAEREKELITELAGLVNASMLTVQEATDFLQMQDSNDRSLGGNRDLPAGVMSRIEALDLVNKTNNQLKQGEVEVLRKQLEAQKRANDLLTEIKNKPNIGIIN